jgi:hypothetical protein
VSNVYKYADGLRSVNATPKQVSYIESLIDRHDENATLEDVIHEINPDMEDDEDFMDWIRRQSVRRASEVIEILKENL